MDSHGNSMSFLSTTRLGGSLVESHTKFHDDFMSFIQILHVFHEKTWHGFWTSSSHGISEAFAKKMTGFPADSVSFWNSTKLPSKTHDKIHATFLRGLKSMIGKSFIFKRWQTKSFVVPGSQRLRMKMVREVNGAVYIWFHANGEDPTWFPEPIPGIELGQLVCRGHLSILSASHIQVLFRI